MDRGSGEIRSTSVLLAQISGEVVTQPVIEGQLTRHLPGILCVDAELLLTGPWIGRSGIADSIDLSQQEAGVAETHIGSAHGLLLLDEAGIGCGEGIAAIASIWTGVKALQPEFAA